MLLTILLFGSLTLIFGYSAYRIYKTTRKVKIAKWARSNKKQARVLLIGFNLAMALTGISIGMLFTRLDIHLSQYAIYAGLALFAIGTFLFPSNDKASPVIAGRYKRKQILTTLRVGGSSLALIAFANEYVGSSGESLVQEGAVSPVILILLATLGLVVFGLGILVLSCGLACNGYEGFALIVLVGGSIGLITLYVISIRTIMRKSRERKATLASAHSGTPRMSNQEDILDDTSF